MGVFAQKAEGKGNQKRQQGDTSASLLHSVGPAVTFYWMRAVAGVFLILSVCGARWGKCGCLASAASYSIHD